MIPSSSSSSLFFQFFYSTFFISIFNIIFNCFLPSTSAQGLNDPSSHYIEGRLGGRRIWWCPSGYGYLAYCPQPTDWDNYNWCCTFPYMGSWKPSCCPFAIPTGAVITLLIASIILISVLVGFSCWCCYFCPLYKKLYENDEEDEIIEQQQIYSTQRQQQQFEE